jgi:anaerobic magnesium-protoporphyrin IX monomethyl ester cyclase
MNFKFAIINPKTRSVLDTNEPLNILTLATYLQNHGIGVRIIDELAGDNVSQELKDFNPDLVGFTATTCTYPRAVEMLRGIIKPAGYKTIIGGVHASTMPEKAIEDGFDMVVVGEGEKTTLDLIKQGKTSGIFKTTAENILKSEEIPLPDRRLINMDYYRCTKQHSPHDPNLDFVPAKAYMGAFLTSRGCPFSCIFCHNTWRGTPLRFLSAELIIEEVEKLIKEYGIRYIWFLDDDFFIKKDRVAKFCQMAIDRKLNFYWATSTRPDSVNDDILSLAAKAGCKRLAFGFESGSQRILEVLNKRSNVEENLKVTRLCRKHKIDVLGLMMVGNPTETREDIALTRKFIRKAKLDSIAISVTTPFPGTQLWKWCEKENLIPGNMDFSSFYYTNAPIRMPGTFSPEKVESIKRSLIIETYLSNSRIRRRFFEKLLQNPAAMFEKVAEFIPHGNKKASD